jgi:CheY-like chemotaxis protein
LNTRTPDPPAQRPDAPVNILLVDDQPGKLLTCRTILESLGENLLTVESARGALDVLLSHDVAVILIDVVMPELDGFELAALIREHPRFEQTAIMFVSEVALTDLDRVRRWCPRSFARGSGCSSTCTGRPASSPG